MWWNRKTTVEQVEEPIEVPVKNPIDLDKERSAEEIEEYDRLAKLVGYSSPDQFKSRAYRFLAEEGICTYDYDAVSGFLDHKLGKPRGGYWLGKEWGKGWGWRPLGPQDVVRQLYLDYTLGAWIFYSVYDKPIPMPVLTTAAKIRTAFPELKMFVSDQFNSTKDREDPFLAIRFPDATFLVIERWDEPTFRM